MRWSGEADDFLRWCADERDPDLVERALRSVPALLWPSLRPRLERALDAGGPFSPVWQRFEAVDGEMGGSSNGRRSGSESLPLFDLVEG